MQKQLERVTEHNKKVMEQRLQRESPEKKHSLLQAKGFAADERRCQIMQKNLDRVVSHNKKVMERRRNMSTEMHEGRKSLCLQLESKQQNALQKRDELIKQVQEKAQAAAKKSSPMQSESSKAAN